MGVGEPQKLYTALENANLQLALYTNTGRLVSHRKNALAVEGMENFEDLRTQANRLKKHTIDHLDHYLEEFERNVEAHGGKVIYCEDATQVADFILGLAKERGSKLIVKSKSMTTEELDLN